MTIGQVSDLLLIPDISHHQGPNIDWAAVMASGRAGGIVKATEGTGHIDPMFAGHWARLGVLPGALRGAYHFARPGASTPEAQAAWFLRVVGLFRPSDILILDLEVGDGDLTGWALAWLRAVAKAGARPWLYSYGPFIQAHLQGTGLAAYPLWLAAYRDQAPAAPKPWASYILWQHTDKADVPGIGRCDQSRGSLTDITALLGRPAQAAPGPAPATPTGVKPMFDPPIGPLAAVWQREGTNDVIAAVSPDGHVYAWGCPWAGNVAGRSWWGNRQAAGIGARPDGMPGYRITSTDGSTYDLPYDAP